MSFGCGTPCSRHAAYVISDAWIAASANFHHKRGWLAGRARWAVMQTSMRSGGRVRWLTVTDIADELGVSVSTVYKWSRRGTPDFPKCSRLPNGSIRVSEADLSDWMEGRAQCA